MTALFAQASVAGFDGFTVIPGGWFDHHWVQLGYQLADSTAGFGYSFTMTTIILWIMHFIPGCRMRCDEETEILGMDDAEMGEFAYDYVGIDAQAKHAFHDNTHSHGDVPPTTGGREPHHVHAQTIVVDHNNTKDRDSTGGSEIEKTEQPQ